MPELRKDPLTGRWVIVAPERSLRPRELHAAPSAASSEAFCPFCPGREALTGPPLATIQGPVRGAPNAPWLVRVVANRYPALRVEGALDGQGDGLYDQLNGVGAHEVIVESPLHEASWSTMPIPELQAVLRAYRERMLDLRRDFRLKYLLIFKNLGLLAGATLAHPHSQLVALPLVPPAIEMELQTSRRHYEQRGRCLLCDVMRQELRDGGRVVYDSEAFVAWTPYASRYPFEVWVAPKVHQAHFEAADDRSLGGLARALSDVSGRLDAELGKPAHNVVLHSTPPAMSDLPYYHWHIEITPMLYHPSAGFELGSGCYINATPPEVAAHSLRQAELGQDGETL